MWVSACLDLKSRFNREVRHSTLSRTRKRLPAEVFETCFQSILTACVAAGMVSGYTQVDHSRSIVDAALVEANAY
jgi:hypothetical protein